MGGKRYNNYDWNAIQEFYDANHTITEVDNKFGCGYKSRKRAMEHNLFHLRDKASQQLSNTKRNLSLDHLIKLSKLHNDNMATRELYKHGFTGSEYRKAIDLKLIKPKTLEEAAKIRYKKYGPNHMSNEARAQQSIRMSENNPGGKCKWYEVSGKKVQGRWERDFALKLNELLIKWERCKSWLYIKDTEQKRYTPDFYLPDRDIYIEIKGYWWGDDRKKMNCVIAQHPEKNIIIIEEYVEIINFK